MGDLGPLGQEDPLEKEMALQCSCLETLMARGAWRATVHGSQRLGHDRATNAFTVSDM